MKQDLFFSVKGHCQIVDDLGKVLVNKSNAIHPQNMARIIARALANEPQSSIYRMAFGNGGTVVDAAYSIQYNHPNDGQPPDIATWDSRIYNETYSEVVDDSSSNIGTDPGSADLNTGVRPGGGSTPSSDPITVEHISGPGARSNELGVVSEVVISCTLNGNEPRGQFSDDSVAGSVETDFVFDEIGLYTEGAGAISSSGYQQVKFGNIAKTSTDDTGLLPNTQYTFNLTVDGGTMQTFSFVTPAVGTGSGGQILFGDFCHAMNTNDAAWNILPSAPNATFTITDLTGGAYPSISNAQTYGNLQVTSPTAGNASSVTLAGPNTSVFISQLSPPIGGTITNTVNGTAAGLQNSPTTPALQRERLLAHLIFPPVLKSANRTLAITYTITISVARTEEQ